MRYYWDMMTLCFMVWVVIEVPFMYAFNVDIDETTWGWHRIFAYAVRRIENPFRATATAAFSKFHEHSVRVTVLGSRWAVVNP